MGVSLAATGGETRESDLEWGVTGVSLWAPTNTSAFTWSKMAPQRKAFEQRSGAM